MEFIINAKEDVEINEILNHAIKNSDILKSKNATMYGYFEMENLKKELEYHTLKYVKEYIKNTETMVRDILLNDLIENEKNKYN